MSYTLLEHGGPFEQQHWGLVEETWSNYEVLWCEFIVPLTGRPEHIGLRPGTDPLLEEMCMAHYSIFSHLIRAHLLLPSLAQRGDPARTEDEVFFHMSAATEMVDRFLLILWKIHRKVEGSAAPEPFFLDELLERASAFDEKRYMKAYERYLDTGKSVAIHLHNIRELADLVVAVVGAEEVANDVWRIADEIRSYRNFLTHNPLVPKLVNVEGVVLLPRPAKLTEYDLWSSAFLSQTAQSDYMPACDIARHYLESFESCLDELWKPLIELLTGIGTTDAYAEMLGPPPQGPTVSMPDSAPPTPLGDLSRHLRAIQASGTVSAYEDRPDLAAEDECPESGQ